METPTHIIPKRTWANSAKVIALTMRRDSRSRIKLLAAKRVRGMRPSAGRGVDGHPSVPRCRDCPRLPRGNVRVVDGPERGRRGPRHAAAPATHDREEDRGGDRNGGP